MSGVEQRLSRAISDRYQIISKVGAGGMASVFLAEDRKLKRRVAIKVMNPELAASVSGTRFLKEIRIAAGLAHPHIVPVHDSGEASGLLYFVMRFQEGESLRALLDREAPLPVARSISIARDVAEGLAYALAQGVIHRDIKPANILLTGDHAFIADFGVARAVEGAPMAVGSATSTALGTPSYMSPEQGLADPGIDGRSDVYSLGCVMFEMLTGKPPFDPGNPTTVLARHYHQSVPSVRSTRPDVAQPLAKAVERCLAKSPGARFQSAADVCRVLESAQSGMGSPGLGFKTRWRWLPNRTRMTLSFISGLSLLLLAVALAKVLGPPENPAFDPSAMVVLPFRDANTTPEEEELLVDLADELTRQLNRWESVRAVPQISLSGIRFDMGHAGPTMDRTEDGLGVAEAMGAGTLTVLTARIRGDSVRVTAQLFDVQTGRGRGKPHEALGELRDPSPVAAEVAHLILGLEGSAAEIAGLYRQSAVPEALIRYEFGRKALEHWRLGEGEVAFRRATELDPAFAMAHHLLSLALYWQWEEGLALEELVGEEIAERSTIARRNASSLPLRDSLQILAFNRLQAGDYEAARTHYRTLLEGDSTDVYAWFLQGSVEYHDPWLAESSDGVLRPRSNRNLARRSFKETVRLAPGFQGAYENVFEIETEVARAADEVSAPGFEVPRGEFFAPWAQPRAPYQARVFWPAYLDSLVWLDPTEWGALPDGVAAGGASRLMEESLVSLRRWAAFEPDQARPQKELAAWAVSLRSRLRGPQPPNRVDSLTTEAFQHTSRALALSPDTARNELFQLANLRLAMGDIQGARSAWEFALGWAEPEPDDVFPSLASNVLLFSGRPAQALDLLASERPRTRYYPDPVTNELFADAGADPLIQRLRILGATGVGGPALEEAFRDLTDHLAASQDRTQRELDLLRMLVAPRIAVALFLAPAMLESWVQELDLRDPIWDVLLPEGRDRGGLLQTALEAKEWEVEDPSRSYLLGTVAREIGEGALAVRLFSRLDSLALGVEARDPGWGLLALSYLQRGRAYLAMEDQERANGFYARFSDAWSEPDMEAGLAEEARRRLGRRPR